MLTKTLLLEYNRFLLMKNVAAYFSIKFFCSEKGHIAPISFHIVLLFDSKNTARSHK